MTIISVLDTVATAVAAWLVTFTVHGVVTCAAAVVAGRFLVRRAASRDLLWKTALVLPIVTSLLSISPHSVSLTDLVRRASPVELRPPYIAVIVTRDGQEEHRERRVRDVVSRTVAAFIIMVVFANACAGSARLRKRRRAVMRELSVTWPASPAPRITTTIEAALPGVRVLAGARLLSPVAIGRRTVCVPAVSFPTLSEAQQAGVMAHELAHLKRYDPYWIGFAEWLAALAPHGFVLRLIVFRMRRDSELLCDAAAARSSQSPASLVEALSIFVRDLETAGRVSVHVGYADSPILNRAYRLLYGPMETARPDHWVWAILIAMSLLVATAPRATLVSAPRLNVQRFYWVDQAGIHYEVVKQIHPAQPNRGPSEAGASLQEHHLVAVYASASCMRCERVIGIRRSSQRMV